MKQHIRKIVQKLRSALLTLALCVSGLKLALFYVFEKDSGKRNKEHTRKGIGKAKGLGQEEEEFERKYSPCLIIT